MNRPFDNWTFRKTESGNVAHLQPQDVIVTYHKAEDTFEISMREPVNNARIPSAVLSQLIYG